jgi:hypothetical protein
MMVVTERAATGRLCCCQAGRKHVLPLTGFILPQRSVFVRCGAVVIIMHTPNPRMICIGWAVGWYAGLKALWVGNRGNGLVTGDPPREESGCFLLIGLVVFYCRSRPYVLLEKAPIWCALRPSHEVRQEEQGIWDVWPRGGTGGGTSGCTRWESIVPR